MDYNKRKKEQIEQYRNVEDIHALPEIFHYWSNKFLRPRLNEIIGADGVTEFYSHHFRKALQTSNKRTLLSIGAGDCSLELSIAIDLEKLNVKDYIFECIEISPILIDRGKKMIKNNGLLGKFLFIQEDINKWKSKKKYCGIMAHHSLHHIVELEKTFSNISRSLENNGYFLTNDIIGRNGHMRWPETLKIINSIWKTVPDRYKYNHQLKIFENEFVNFDCSCEGFEGIRSQDILPLLIKYFRFEKFLAYGNLIDVFCDRSFGHNFNPKNEDDRTFIDKLELLNELLIDFGHIKPTAMYAVLSLRECKPKVYKNWIPEFCVRQPD